MNSHFARTRSRRFPSAQLPHQEQSSRRGSTLLIVLSLMGMLALLGVLFYTFAAQERMTAQNFSNDARVLTAPSIEPDGLMDYALEQLILGPDDTKVNSALWGGRHSLVPNMLGRDGIPFNGEGVNVRVDSNGNPFVDQAYSGGNNGQDLLRINDSMMTNVGGEFSGETPSTLPAPDVEYTYADINNMFLAFRTTIPHLEDATGRPVPAITPSFHRPAILRSAGIMPGQWFNDTTLVSRMLRANPGHIFANANGATATSRYVTTAAQAATLGLRQPFPMQPFDAQQDGSFGDQGVWSLWSWKSNETVPIGTWTRPTTPNNRYYVATAAGDTGGTEPSWPVNPGATVTDNGVTWTCQSSLSTEYDMDLDGDGLHETVLLDLDFPPQRRGDGKLVVPMFGFYITDGEGLVDLNSSGNLGFNRAGMATNTIFPPDITSAHFGLGANISRSNAGFTAAEINPLYGLYADPVPPSTDFDLLSGADLQMHARFLGMLDATTGNPITPRTLQELKNLEGFFLLMGAPQLTSGTPLTADMIYAVIAGRFGEESSLADALRSMATSSTWSFPASGTAASDDNANYNLVRNPKFGWPFDYQGTGSTRDLSAGAFGKGVKTLNNTTLTGAGPNRWVEFSQFHSNDSSPDVELQLSTFASQLMLGTYNQLSDESLETLTDLTGKNLLNTLASSGATGAAAARTQVEKDQAFGTSETAFLHLNAADGARLASGSRLAKLAPANFVESARAWDIRRQYTTTSGDRREVGGYVPLTSTATAANNTRSWETAFYNSHRGVVQWLLNDAPDSTDPFRGQRWKLSLHQILTNEDGDPYPAANPTKLRFRDLTSHPTSGLASTQVPSGNRAYASNLPTSSLANQEYWARIDRQALARDIYTTLYFLGGHTDQDYTGDNSSFALHSEETLRQMAQFAINVVDSLDSDDVLSRFEYDTNLNNGWSLDNDPYTVDGSSDRAEVWGVERQTLTLSEAIAIHTLVNDQPSGTPQDHIATEWDDTTANYFTYIELRNASPGTVSLENSNWQVMIWPKKVGMTNNLDPDKARQLIFRTGAGTVTGGGLFTIGGDVEEETDAGVLRPSYFRVDPAGGSSFQQIFPANSVTLDLDLIKNRAANRFLIADGNQNNLTSTAGSFYDANNADVANPASEPFVVSLRRRANLQRTTPTVQTVGAIFNSIENDDNPWVEVDRMEITTAGSSLGATQIFAIEQDSTPAEIAQLIERMTSKALRSPFDRANPLQDSATVSQRSHTIGADFNGNPAGTITQFHFDRPFMSAAELFEVPLEGHSTSVNTLGRPHPLRMAISAAKLSGAEQYSLTSSPQRTVTYGGQVTLPSNATDYPNSVNRWYRLLNYFEIPGTTNRDPFFDDLAESSVGVPQEHGWPRAAGRINVNTLRHYMNLAALLDDPNVFNVRPPETFQSAFLDARDTADLAADPFQGTGATGPRDWWKQFLLSRDSFDGATVDVVSGLVLPGTGNSRPFRGMDFVARKKVDPDSAAMPPRLPIFSRDDTILRTLPADRDAALANQDDRLLFELTNQTEHRESNIDTALDSYGRYRLYQKVLNRTTVRSNTFMVYVGVQFHEAAITSTGAVRIGGRLEDTPIHRGFFVVDRSEAIDQVKRLMAPATDGGPTNPLLPGTHFDATTSTFGLLKEKTLPSGVDYYSYRALSSAGADDGIDWKSLIKYRQLLN